MNKIVVVPVPSALTGLMVVGTGMHKIPAQIKIRVEMWKMWQRSSNGRMGVRGGADPCDSQGRLPGGGRLG